MNEKHTEKMTKETADENVKPAELDVKAAHEVSNDGSDVKETTETVETTETSSE